MNALDYDRLAHLHRPTDPAVLAAEIRRLRQNGLTARDISDALRIDMGVVLNALAPFSSGASIDRRGTDIPRRASTARPGDFKT